MPFQSIASAIVSKKPPTVDNKPLAVSISLPKPSFIPPPSNIADTKFTALVIPFARYWNTGTTTVCTTDARPSNKAFNKAPIDVTKNQGIGTYLQSPKMGVLISDNDGKKLTINVFPVKLFFSESARQLQTTAENNRLKYLKLAEQQAAATSKKSTITCVKGKLTKKVTAVKPVCPKGYKKK